MNFNADQITAASKANVESLAAFTSQAFAGFEQLVELNVAASKAALAESFLHAQALLSAKDAQEVLALQSGLVQPMAEKAVAYNRHIYNIASTSGAELSKAVEAQFAKAQQNVNAVVDNAAKNAPAGTENAVALFKNAMTASQTAIETAQNAAKRAVEVAESNFNAATSQVASAVATPTAKKR
ncbi:MAG: phasin family protein [Burkholderiaceae bacterium]|mgnify:CR=1 FL=1|nr:phasin family protein [Burkholderiaceae bacterium]